MGKCSECGNKIQYNSFKVIKGIVYCLDCVPSKVRKIVDKKLTEALGEPMKIVVKKRKKSRRKKSKKANK